MAAIEQAKAHFSRLMVRTIEVPEWAGDDGAPMVIYAKPLTLTEKQKLRYFAQNGGDLDVLAHTLIMKAENSQGEKLFTVEHKHALMNATDPDVLSRVVMQITRPRGEDEIEKK